MKVIKGGITSAKGFKANGINCGIKKRNKLDLALITSDTMANGAAVFTKNSIKAAPIIVSAHHIRNQKIQAIIVNSGNANCYTGHFGQIYARQTTELVANILDIDQKNVLVSSTGIIGKPLPFKKIESGIEQLHKGLGDSHKKGKQAAEAILTTDTRIKEAAVTITIGGKRVTIGGCSKGSGMVDPNMATMLGFITTDCAINPKLLKIALSEAANESFNCMTIDGCTSTNDMVAIMANGHAKNTSISKAGKDFNKFYEALLFVCNELSKQIVLDAEGISKYIEIYVSGAKTFNQAKEVGLAIANSVLVKTAAYGSNPNWGRIAQAVGSVGIQSVTEHNLKIGFSDFSKKEIQIDVDLNIGNEKAKIITSDLTHEYIKINTDYN